jgi:hypothetical protein
MGRSSARLSPLASPPPPAGARVAAVWAITHESAEALGEARSPRALALSLPSVELAALAQAPQAPSFATRYLAGAGAAGAAGGAGVAGTAGGAGVAGLAAAALVSTDGAWAGGIGLSAQPATIPRTVAMANV